MDQFCPLEAALHEATGGIENNRNFELLVKKALGLEVKNPIKEHAKKIQKTIHQNKLKQMQLDRLKIKKDQKLEEQRNEKLRNWEIQGIKNSYKKDTNKK